jgi:hypothetical protein
MLAKKILDEDIVPVPSVKLLPLIVFPLRFPVEVRLLTVVDPIVELPEMFKLLPAILPVDVRLEIVVDAKVDDPLTDRLVIFEVEAFVVVA